MAYCIGETFAYCRIYVAQIFNFALNSPVLLRKPTPIGLHTVVMIWNSCYFRSQPSNSSGICFFELFMMSGEFSHVSRDPMKPSHMTNQEKLLKISSQ